LVNKLLTIETSSSCRADLAIRKMIAQCSTPVIRMALEQSMKMLGQHFVMGETIQVAIQKAVFNEEYRYSYDVLGEAARTALDAEGYFFSYKTAIRVIAEENAKMNGPLDPIEGPGISVKLSALHPRYGWAKQQRMIAELFPKLKELALQAKAVNIGFTIDAEESSYLDLSLMLVQMLVADQDLAGWQGFGLAVQAYQKRASFIIDWLIELAKLYKRRLMIRLVKGAYWDAEIKWSQERGLIGYPVFTRKVSTDISYLVCAKKLLSARDVIYPQFATHNAHTVSCILEMAKGERNFEFQCLYGMGVSLYDNIVKDNYLNVPCRVYAPVGEYNYLLAYLVRRLLENGANNSFVNRIVDGSVSIEQLIENPIEKFKRLQKKPHPKIPLPINLYGPKRPNSKGLDLTHHAESTFVLNEIKRFLPNLFDYPVIKTSAVEIETIMERASKAASSWDNTLLGVRAQCLEKMASLLEENKIELMAFLIREGGKTIQDALSEVREAIDFCWYYSCKAKKELTVQTLPGPTGEHNQLELHGRGVIVCISPWNFPLAIFLGQITAALVAGNVVIAKPASQTVLIALKVMALLQEAGVPSDVVQLVIGSGEVIGDHLVQDPRIQGVMFTGSIRTAWHINQLLAARVGPIIPFIAETGGQNAMIVDSSALLEQVVNDIIVSAFNSAGQRCSALRVAFIQEEIFTQLIVMLKGAIMELAMGDPLELATDVGPVIDENAAKLLQKHMDRMQQEAKLIYECALPRNLPQLPRGVFFAPRVYQIQDLAVLTEEVFGPILHVISYKAQELSKVIETINKTQYGLTFGIHSRIDKTVQDIQSQVRVGNIYVNRNMIGAVVGVQPFGGEGLSGTGPKAGGPYMLPRLVVERTVSVNTAATGGNVTLVSLEE
jgi:RHH-type proline utilization regulon transcriptional repressor/proline dehydrogenase/delta 1-pyrroline-5-carboxylate dehydrogenase